VTTALSNLDRYVELTQRKRELEAELRIVKRDLGDTEPDLLEEFKEGGWRRVNHAASGVTVYLHRQIWARPATDQAPQALKDAGLGQYVQEGFNVHSLSAYFRELAKNRVEQGDPVTDLEQLLPPELQGHIHLTQDVGLRAA
jgi:hypothetical protein